MVEGRTTNLPKLLGIILGVFAVQFIVLSWYFDVKFEDIHGHIFQSRDSLAALNEPFRRAVIVYFPHEQVDELMPQFLGLRHSWLEMSKHEPEKWRTDLFVYTNGLELKRKLEPLGCYNIRRQSNDEPNRCVVDYTYQTMDFLEPEANTINIAAQPRMNAYQWIFRSDIHAFLTPAFATWKPAVMTFSFTEFSPTQKSALVKFASTLNISSITSNNIGTTWYGPTKLIRGCASLAVELMHQIVKEPTLKSGTGTESLRKQSSFIAINECTHGFEYDVRQDLLDVSVFSSDSISTAAHLIVPREKLSSFVKQSKEMNSVDDVESIKDYALAMAAPGYHVAESTSAAVEGSTANGNSAQEDTTTEVETSNKLSETLPVDSASVEPSVTESNPVDLKARESSLLRAAIVFIPTGSEGERFVQQLRWFRRSWQHMQKSEPDAWRTDIVIFTDGPIPLLNELDCKVTNTRTTRDEPNKCVVIEGYKRLKSKEFDYSYGDSINVVAQDNAAVQIYDWILRTDIDTFLTPAFSAWKPFKMTVGRGGYSFSENNEARLTRISSDMGLKSSKLNNIGSTWYGPAKLIRECAQLTVKAMKYLHEKEFTEQEKSAEYGTKGWPEWHYGVLTLYAGHVAINHCTHEAGVVKDDVMIDFPTSSSESTMKHAHLHTWQNDERFSKFIFLNGGYDKEDKASLDIKVVNDYAMFMALDSLPKPVTAVSENKVDKTVVKPKIFIRAAVVFIPRRDRQDVFVKQFRWFHRSWIEMQKHEPEQWRTDIIVYSNGIIKDLWEFGCTTEPRLDKNEPNKCVTVPNYEILVTKDFNYRYGDSINVVAVDTPYYDTYDYLLRTDIDVFLTSAFSTWYPGKTVVGGGGYQTDDNLLRLTRISHDLGLSVSGLEKIGSTWYGPTKVLRECAKLTVKMMKHIHEKEFTAFERSDEFGTKGWPGWHYGVLSLYAGHIAINHCTHGQSAEKNENMLDYPTSAVDKTKDHAHLHTWQNSIRFSKFAFDEGKYASEDINALDVEKVSDYAMYIALDSQAISDPTPVPIQYPADSKQGQVQLRAVVVYLPSDNEVSLSKFRILHQSWKEMLKTEPLKWRSDLIVFTDTAQGDLNAIDCQQVYRTTAEHHSICVQINSFKFKSGQNITELRKSFEAIGSNVPEMQAYSWIMHTELESLLTPQFSTWIPDNMVVGTGSLLYVDMEIVSSIEKAHELKQGTMTNIGSTWYGPVKAVQLCAEIAQKVLEYLEREHGTSMDKSQMNSLATHVAINHCMHSTTLVKEDKMLDVPTTSDNDLIEVAHLHAIKTSPNQQFNLDDFFNGLYASIKYSTLQMETVRDYAMKMALKSHGGLIPTPSPHAATNAIDSSHSVLRAAVVYLPSGKYEEKFLREFRWFRRSWIEMLKTQPASWRTDIIVYTDGDGAIFKAFDCHLDGKRSSKSEINQCIISPRYKAVRTKEFNYGYADSINILTDGSDLLTIYDFILRTDLDTFLTPGFSNWKPEKVIVGFGQYSNSDTNRERLDRIISDMKLTNSNLENIGSTWYGPTKVIRDCAKLTMKAMKYLHEKEFTAEEKSEEYGVKGWPEWHYGVLTLYAGHIAINHCTHEIGVIKDEMMLDYPTTSDQLPSEHAHLHTWQNHEIFSKYDFADGKYSQIDIKTLSLNKIRDYAMYMALDSTPDHPMATIPPLQTEKSTRN